ncbi:PDZ domain-containing protein MAGIX isoform X2 [Erinaceus europaeus]|uniref:PDZ domain-containing protein MAGIX isoform X2 n=1 Tax=Erinaceus europaeus TaxID=9365 RepID=A0A1S3WJI5_ERIEU|nr:PDZ domain-containing protein MAGIX isoform X2 [Erinaceus europaeus]
MERLAGEATNRRENRGGHSPPPPSGPKARQLLARLDARPLAARAANDMAALVRRAGTTLRLRPKESLSMQDAADIEVTDNRLPNVPLVENGSQHRRVAPCTGMPQVTQGKGHRASKLPPDSSQFCVELVRGPSGFGLTLSSSRGAAGGAPLAIRGLLDDGPAQRCGRLQAGDLVLHINGESTQGLTPAEAMERIQASHSRHLRLVIRRPLETHPGRPKGVSRPPKGDDHSPDPGRQDVQRSCSASISPSQFANSPSVIPQTQVRREPNLQGAADSPAVPPAELGTEGPDDRIPGSPGPWLVPSDERLARALGVPGSAQLLLEVAAGRRRH